LFSCALLVNKLGFESHHGQNKAISKNSILKNNLQLFYMNSNEDNLYIKIEAINMIYNFVVENIFI